MNEYEIALTIGGCLAALWLVAYVLCWAGQWAWAWIDDGETSKVNAIVNWFMLKQGWKKTGPKGGCFTYYKGEKYWADDAEKSDGIALFIFVLLGAAFIPVLTLLAFKVYPVTLTISVVIGVAFLARFARRNKKMFDAHAADKDAHANP